MIHAGLHPHISAWWAGKGLFALEEFLEVIHAVKYARWPAVGTMTGVVRGLEVVK